MRVFLRVAAAGALAVLALPWLEPVWWAPGLLVHFPLQIAAGSLALLVPAYALRERGAAVVLGLALAVSLFQARDYWPRFPAAQASAADLVVATVNLDYRNGDLARAADFLQSLAADVVVLPEYTPAAAERFRRLQAVYPYRLEAAAEGAFGIAMFSRHPLQLTAVRYPGGVRTPMLDAVLDRGEGPIRIFGVHPPAPVSPVLASRRDAQMAALASLVAGSPGDVIVAGDFNDTPFSRSFRRLLRTSGLANAAAGRGYPATFPAAWPPLWIPIDHCLYRGDLRVVTVRSGPDIGADHFPLVATFRNP